MAILTVYDNQGNAIPIPAIKGPKGDKGDTGNAGTNGIDGQDGKSAYQSAVDGGYSGTETQWLESLKGDSAYQVAIDNGFSGTELEWLASLKGDKGDTGDSTTLGPISSENTSSPPSGAAVAEALANAAPNLTPENYLEIVEETTGNPGEEETITKIRTTIGNTMRHQEHAYDDIVITVDEADYSYVHELPVISTPTNYNLDKIRLIGEEFDTNFQSFTNVVESKTNTIPFVSGDFDKHTVNNANAYGSIIFYNQNDMANGVGNKFKSQGTIIITENENDTPVNYTLEKETTLRFRVPSNLQGTDTGTMIEQQVLPQINGALDTGDPSSMGMSGGSDCALFFSNIYNKQEALDAALLCLIGASSSVDSNFVLTPIDQTAPMFMYLAAIGKNSNIAAANILGLFTDLDLENYYLVQESLTQNQLSYFKYNTTTTVDSMMNDDTNIIETNSDEPALLITFDEDQAEIISSRNLKYQNLQIILDKVGKIQWPGETIQTGPHLEVRNNKIDFPYGREFITFQAEDSIKYTSSNNNYSSGDNPYYTLDTTLTSSQYSLSNTTVANEEKMVCKIKTLNKTTQDIIEWKTTKNGNYIFAAINIKDNYLEDAYESEYFYSTPEDKLKISCMMAYKISDSSLRINLRVPSEQLSNPNYNVEIQFGDYVYGIKKIPAEMLEVKEIETTNSITQNSTEIPTAGAVYTAIENGGKVKTVNNQQPDSNGNINITIPTVPDIRDDIYTYRNESSTTTNPFAVYNYAMHFLGTTTTSISDGSAGRSYLSINGSTKQAKPGDIVIYNNKKFIYSDDGYWRKFGDDASVFTSSAAGLVPTGGTSDKILAGNGTWVNYVKPGDNNNYNIVVSSNTPSNNANLTNTLWFVYS